MVDLDVRSRSDADVRALDFEHFFERELPERLAAAGGALAARGARQLSLGPLGFDVGGRSYTLIPGDDTISIRTGADAAAAVAALDAEGFSDLMQDLCSTMGLTLGSDVTMRRGGVDDFVEWEPVLRAMMDERPVYEPGSVDFRDVRGRPLDLRRNFTPDDDDEEMAHFLGEAGFLHVRGLFRGDEMDEVSRDIDRALPCYEKDDGRSWWAATGNGQERPVRLQFFHEHSPLTTKLLRDPRFLRLAALSSSGHVPGPLEGQNVVEALVKPIDVVEGISDVPWHKDCSLGRHSYRCCGMTVGICVTDADRESGELGVVAGSHRASVPPVGVHPLVELPRIALTARKGDVTVHLSCTLHMSRPPTGRERRVLYSGFGLPLRPGEKPIGEDRLRAIREGAPKRMGAESRQELGRVGSFELDD